MTHDYFLSLARLSLLCLQSRFLLGGREELLASLCTWTFPSFCVTLSLGTGSQTFLRGEGALGSGRFELYQEALGIVPRGARAFASLLFTVLVFLVIIPGHCVIVFLWSCFPGGYTRWLVWMGVVYPEKTTFMQR